MYGVPVRHLFAFCFTPLTYTYCNVKVDSKELLIKVRMSCREVVYTVIWPLGYRYFKAFGITSDPSQYIFSLPTLPRFLPFPSCLLSLSSFFPHPDLADQQSFFPFSIKVGYCVFVCVGGVAGLVEMCTFSLTWPDPSSLLGHCAKA